ncbi:diacylglycerol kinase [Actinokineospora iranica]|uniref:Diacylglycerol kinase n=1 Tax=Actinokineospora iranica TaxID=1271860 RepID=A0A1G6IVD5_9PSEU|nr:diacylglycerol kinase [Actinokineospora iranica]
MVAARLRDVVGELTVVEATSVAESRALAARAADRGLDLLVVLGGDGSVHQGVRFCAEHRVALAVVASGTGNDFARALGLPLSPLAGVAGVVAAIESGARRRVDLGRVGGGEWFASVLCAGFDAAVSERGNRMRWPHGRRRYDLAIAVELAALRARPLVVDTGGADGGVVELAATMVAVGNTAFYGGGIPVCPGADPADGLLDVTVVGRVSRWDLLRILPSLRGGGHVAHPAVRTMRARRVALGADNGWVAYADGERMGPLPVVVECVPGAVEIVG